jgi:hypothetical protein
MRRRGAPWCWIVAAVFVGGCATAVGRASPPSSPVPTTTGPGVTRSVTPGFLPAGVRLASHRWISRPLNRHRPVVNSYRLPGSINRSNISHPGVALADRHTATEVQVMFAPGLRSWPRGYLNVHNRVNRRLFRQRTIQIAGNRGLITIGKADPTEIRVDWIDAAGSHIVQCEGLVTSQGQSGLSPSVMIRIARSLYPHS